MSDCLETVKVPQCKPAESLWERYPNTAPLFSKLEFPNMKYVLLIVTIMSLGGLTGCQPNASGNIVTSGMGGSDDNSGY